MLYYKTIMKYSSLVRKAWIGMFLTAFIFLSIGIVATADGQQNIQGGKTSSDNLEKVVLHLRWYHQFQFAGYYAAVEKGFFHELGLDVTLVEGSPKRDVIEEVVAGRAHYGVTNSTVLLNRLRGKPLVVLATIFQHSPFALLSLKDSGIATPQDLIGRRVMMMKGVNNAEIMAMLHNEGISADQIQSIEATFEINDLIEGETDAFNAYVTNEHH
jgi:ABC-type nitrate/sulfonate/bicarbonate transport system substrate-binding protein